MKTTQKFFLFFSFLISIHSEIQYSTCNNGTRTLIFEDRTRQEFDCIPCPIGQFTTYNKEKNLLECAECPSGSTSYGNDINLLNFAFKSLSKFKFYAVSDCEESSEKCPMFSFSIFSLNAEFVENTNFKEKFMLNTYYMNDGEFSIKYINFNGGVDKVFNIYLNDKLIFKDDSEHSVVKTKNFNIKKGENNFIFEYSVDNKLKTKGTNLKNDAYLKILELNFTNLETSSTECEQYESLENLKNNLHNNCDYYIEKCNSEDFCTYRFYKETINEICSTDTKFQTIEYSKLSSGNCKELINPVKREIGCEHCSYGQFLTQNNNETKCDYCSENLYNSKEINDEKSCNENCDENKELSKINYITNFEDASYGEYDFEIVNSIGFLIVYYQKFNENKTVNIFFELDKNEKSFKLENPIEDFINTKYYSVSLPFSKGEHKIKIKGDNLKLKKFILKGGNIGGNYKCADKVNSDEEKTCTESDEHYSKIQKNCIKCPKGSLIDKNSECIFANQIINKKFTFDNNILKNLLSREVPLEKESVKYYLNLNPSFPFIYSENNSNDLTILAKELYKIKIVKGEKERGILLSFLSYDNDNDLYTHIYLKCDTISKPGLDFVKNVGNNYFFIVNSTISCPYCLTSEVKYEDIDDKCIDGKKTVNVIIKNESQCVIKDFDESESSKSVDDNEVLLYKNSEDVFDKLLIENFGISENVPVDYEKEKDEIETKLQKVIKCGDDDDDDDDDGIGTWLVVVIVISVLLVIVLVGIIVTMILKKRNKKSSEMPELTRESLTEIDKD